MGKNKIQIYDTTLRDGSQMQGISFSVGDKIKIITLLDELGIDCIEGGWPGANPKDIEFFEEAKKLKLKYARLSAFGSTRRADSENCEQDIIVQALLKADTPIVTIVGKTWDLHVEVALRTSLENNLAMIADTIQYLKSQNKEVVFDSEHFFDAYFHNKEYALKVIQIALSAGADIIALCDTNGGSLPQDIQKAVQDLKQKFPQIQLGIHSHNDGGLAIANSLMALQEGAMQVQGTINGYGERCGNADLVSIICNLELKLEQKVLPSADHLKKITHISHSVSEIANLNPSRQQAFVGAFAFTHKGGLHASAIRRDSKTYEHIKPELIGNTSQVIVSEQSGLSNILDFAKNRNLNISEKAAKELLSEIKDKEHLGYQFDQADASLELLFLKKLDCKPYFFEVIDFKVFASLNNMSEATIRIKIGNDIFHTASLGVGPGHALDNALRKALERYYETLKNFRLTDFKVRVIDSHDGTAGRTRVNVETADGEGRKWNTVGLHENILQATFLAIKESIEYGLYCTETQSKHF